MHIASCITREFLRHFFDIIKDKSCMCSATKFGVDSTDSLLTRVARVNSRKTGVPRVKLNTSLRPMYN